MLTNHAAQVAATLLLLTGTLAGCLLPPEAPPEPEPHPFAAIPDATPVPGSEGLWTIPPTSLEVRIDGGPWHAWEPGIVLRSTASIDEVTTQADEDESGIQAHGEVSQLHLRLPANVPEETLVASVSSITASGLIGSSYWSEYDHDEGVQIVADYQWQGRWIRFIVKDGPYAFDSARVEMPVVARWISTLDIHGSVWPTLEISDVARDWEAERDDYVCWCHGLSTVETFWNGGPADGTEIDLAVLGEHHITGPFAMGCSATPPQVGTALGASERIDVPGDVDLDDTRITVGALPRECDAGRMLYPNAAPVPYVLRLTWDSAYRRG